QSPCMFKCASEGRLLTKRTIEVCITEVRPLALVLAPKGTPVSARRCNDECVRVRKRWNEASRMARRDHNDAPSYPCAIQHRLDLMGRQRPQSKARHVDCKAAFNAVGRQKEKQGVPIGMHQLAQMLQYRIQVGCVGEWNVVCRAWMVDEGDRPSIRPEPIVKQLTHCQYLALEDRLTPVAGEANEVELGLTGGSLQLAQRALQQFWLPRCDRLELWPRGRR